MKQQQNIVQVVDRYFRQRLAKKYIVVLSVKYLEVSYYILNKSGYFVLYSMFIYLLYIR